LSGKSGVARLERPDRRDRPRDQTRVRDALLVALTVSSGAVDALSWLALGSFSAFMTGNLVFLGVRTGGADGPPVARVLAAVAGFALGAALAARIVRGTRDHGEAWPRRVTVALSATLLAQAAFLGLWWSVGGHPSGGSSNLLLAVSALAMGMQTTAISSLGVRGVLTTAATATLALFMGDLSGWSQSNEERRRVLAVVVGLFAGALIGGVLVVHARSWAPVFPLGVTALVVTAATRSFQRGESAASRPVRGSPGAPLRDAERHG
jgi:uncharacterized membrane protein YoaK (UPF0700 family)